MHAFLRIPPVLRFFCLLSAGLFIVCLLTEVFARHSATFAHLPYTGLTFQSEADYVDYTMFIERFHHYGSSIFFSPKWGADFLYPATLATFYALFETVFGVLGHYKASFLATILLVYIALAVIFYRVLVRRGVATRSAAFFVACSLVFSYPFFFEFNRANMELFVWLLAGMGVWAFLRERFYTAAVFIGIAGACKFFPFIYVGLLLARRKYLSALLAFAVGGVFTVLSLWLLTHDISYSQHQVNAGLAEFRQMYVLSRRSGEIGLDHSLFALIKRMGPSSAGPNIFASWLQLYLAALAVGGCLLWFLRGQRLPAANQVLFLTAASLVLPPSSYDYRLLHLYTPWALLVLLAWQEWRMRSQTPRGFWAVFFCFALLMSPQNEFIWHGERLEGPIKCLVLCAVGALALIIRFPDLSETRSEHKSVELA